MSRILKTTTALGLLVAMGACSSSSGGDDPVSRSGLPFATDDIPSLIEGLTPGQVLSIVLKTVVIDNDVVLTETLVDEFDVSFTPDPMTELTDLTGSLTFNGETYDAVNGVVDFGDGDTLTFRNDIFGSASVLSSVEVNNDDAFNAGRNPTSVVEKSYFVLGFETPEDDMSDLAAVAGSTIYLGDFEGFGQISNVSNVASTETIDIFGSVEFDVDFMNNDIDGSLTITDTQAADNGVEFIGLYGGGSITLSLDAGTKIIGNGFDGTANVVDGPAGVSNSSIDGVFYGADAAELSGTALIDYESETGWTLEGTGGYVAPID